MTAKQQFVRQSPFPVVTSATGGIGTAHTIGFDLDFELRSDTVGWASRKASGL